MNEPNWEIIKERIQDRYKREKSKYNIYFAGGSLCIDFEDGLICLNLDGSWFRIFSGQPINMKGKVQPNDVHELVKQVYLETKGETVHYVMETGELAKA